MTNLAGHPLYTITFRTGRRTHTMQAFVADIEAARAYFDRVISPDWTAGCGSIPVYVGAALA